LTLEAKSKKNMKKTSKPLEFSATCNRRQFLRNAGIAATGAVLAPHVLFGCQPADDRQVRLGIVNYGYGRRFYFHEHPNCTIEAVVSDFSGERLSRLLDSYGASRSYDTIDELLADPDIDAVFTSAPIPDRAREVLKILNAGKHVLSMDNAAMTLEECRELKETVERTGLVYMMAETSVYRQNTISVQNYYHEGKFGKIFCVDAEYLHPAIESLWYDSEGNPTWHRGFPPIQYITHCTSFFIAVTGERLTHVSCLGWGDDSPILIDNAYENPFWNETALFKSEGGTMVRLRVWRRGAAHITERADWYGDKMSFNSQHPNGMEAKLVHASEELGPDEGGFMVQQPVVELYEQPLYWQTDMLPEPLRHDSNHDGSHSFITHDFIDAILNNRSPDVDIYEALAYTAPGIVAHQSALQGGEWLEIPQFDLKAEGR
jgi:predicted dehydrogenase